MSSKIGIKDVARAAGLSTATVSYVLNETRSVKESTRQRVLSAVRQLGYRPNVMARSLQAQRAYLIGYSWRSVSARHSSPVLNRFIHRVGQAAYKAGYHLLAFPAPSDQDEVKVYRELVVTNRVDGIVLSNTNRYDPRVAYLHTTAMPYVAFGRTGDEYDYPWVDVDGYAGGQLAVQQLAAEGYERIGMLAWPVGSQTGEERYEGYLAGLQGVGYAFCAEWVVRVEHEARQGYDGCAQLLALPAYKRPDAVVCVSDLVALGAMNAVRDAGLQVGPDIGIIGFDDIPLAEHLSPPLSSIHQPINQIAELVIRQLTSLIEGKSLTDEEKHILLKPNLIIRPSSLRPDVAY